MLDRRSVVRCTCSGRPGGAEVPGGESSVQPPLFIVGTSRSGTSWAFDLIASHPDMSMGYESKLPVEGAEVYRRHQGTLDDATDMRSLFDELAVSVDDPMNAELSTRLRRGDVVDRAVAAHREAPGWAAVCDTLFRSLEDTTHWGNKLLRIELTPVLTELWPDARFLVLTRDPRGVMASQARKFEHSMDYSAMYWNTHARFVRDRLGLRPGGSDDRHLVVDLVEMATDPRPTLQWAFTAVGLDTAPIGELVERFPGDPGRLDAWRGSLEPRRQRRIEQLCFTGMVDLGYRPELATGPRHMGRLRRSLAMAREHGAELARDPGAIRRKQVGRRVRAALGMGG